MLVPWCCCAVIVCFEWNVYYCGLCFVCGVVFMCGVRIWCVWVCVPFCLVWCGVGLWM